MPPTPYASEAYLHQLIGKALAANASDIHLRVEKPPGARVRGAMVYFRVDKIRPEDTEAAAHVILGVRGTADMFAKLGEYVTAYDAGTHGRFRVSVYRERAGLAIVMRHIAPQVPTLEEIGAPIAARVLAEVERGLVLITGPSGSGRTTTAGAMIDHVNKTFPKHIVTLEDPVELMHVDEKASISQREVGNDTASYLTGLNAVIRQDADVVFVGEIRDAETLEAAFSVAEAGHMVLATMGTLDVIRTLNRLGSVSKNAREARERIADALQGIVSQRLLPKRDGSGLVLAAEVLVGTPAVRDALRNPEDAPPLKELMEKGVSPFGMQSFEMHLRQLIAQNVITKEVAKAAVAL
ncbi:MAG: PilT/PilU family type 4a pilus ATPase [Polyangiaceae bacterium]|nr:PilT/PilU family type 4a pilus ATPase [Polyangiaceae bacterium]